MAIFAHSAMQAILFNLHCIFQNIPLHSCHLSAILLQYGIDSYLIFKEISTSALQLLQSLKNNITATSVFWFSFSFVFRIISCLSKVKAVLPHILFHLSWKCWLNATKALSLSCLQFLVGFKIWWSILNSAIFIYIFLLKQDLHF